MQFILIGANGVIPLTQTGATDYKEASIYAPAAIGTATIDIGWVDDEGTFNSYADGTLLAGESKKYSIGTGANVVATIANYSADFKIGFAG